MKRLPDIRSRYLQASGGVWKRYRIQQRTRAKHITNPPLSICRPAIARIPGRNITLCTSSTGMAGALLHIWEARGATVLRRSNCCLTIWLPIRLSTLRSLCSLNTIQTAVSKRTATSLTDRSSKHLSGMNSPKPLYPLWKAVTVHICRQWMVQA